MVWVPERWLYVLPDYFPAQVVRLVSGIQKACFQIKNMAVHWDRSEPCEIRVWEEVCSKAHCAYHCAELKLEKKKMCLVGLNASGCLGMLEGLEGHRCHQYSFEKITLVDSPVGD